MSIHRTARGREFNMQAFVSDKGDTIAVGNSGRNAQGDLLGSGGTVVANVASIEQVLKQRKSTSSKKVRIHPGEHEISRKEVVGADGVSRWEVMYADGSVEIQENLDEKPTKTPKNKLANIDREPNEGDL